MKVMILSALVAGAAASELKLHTATKTHVHAEYKGLAAEIKHLGDKSGISRMYDSETGENFLQVKTMDGHSKLQYFDHPAFELEMGEDGLAESVHTALPKYLEQFNEHPKMALLEDLSRELGSSNAEHNVAFWVHNLALNRMKSLKAAARARDEQNLLSMDEEPGFGFLSRSSRRKAAARARAEQNLLSTDEEAVMGWGSPPPPSGGSLGNCCGNSCFGRCGDGCSCWSWVCGDCNNHQGCQEHDYYCSCVGMWHYRCISFLAGPSTCNWPGCASSKCARRNGCWTP